MNVSAHRNVNAGKACVDNISWDRIRGIFILTGVALALATANSRAATILDLTTAGSSGTINSAIYQQVANQSTGTGTIDSFAQISPQGNNTTARAYNTTVNNTLNNGASDNFNHSITLADVPLVMISGTPYRQFLLDINESSGGGDEFLSLDDVQVFVGGTANSSIDTFVGTLLDHGGTLVYSMDAGMDNWVALNYGLNSGSGSGDMLLSIPQAAFDGFAGTSVVTLYSQFGLQGVNPGSFVGNFGASAGFEEWALLAVPEPASWGLLAVALVFPRRRRFRS
jgi:hypothetical protein